MGPFDPATVRAAYDAAADDYVATFGDELDQLPVDRSILDAAVGRLRGDGPVIDLGCGPGQVAGYLADRGVPSIGLDLSTQMLHRAHRAHRAHRHADRRAFVGGDLRHLPFRSGSASGAVAFYAIQHLVRSDLPVALGEIRRVVAADGILVIAAHLGEGEVYVPELLGHPVEPMGGTLYRHDELEAVVGHHGFGVEEVRHRPALPHEYPSERIYLIARRREK